MAGLIASLPTNAKVGSLNLSKYIYFTIIRFCILKATWVSVRTNVFRVGLLAHWFGYPRNQKKLRNPT